MAVFRICGYRSRVCIVVRMRGVCTHHVGCVCMRGVFVFRFAGIRIQMVVMIVLSARTDLARYQIATQPMTARTAMVRACVRACVLRVCVYACNHIMFSAVLCYVCAYLRLADGMCDVGDVCPNDADNDSDGDGSCGDVGAYLQLCVLLCVLLCV